MLVQMRADPAARGGRHPGNCFRGSLRAELRQERSEHSGQFHPGAGHLAAGGGHRPSGRRIRVRRAGGATAWEALSPDAAGFTTWVPVEPAPPDGCPRHITDTEARAVPVPEELAALIDQLDERLVQLAADEPLAALRAVARLKHVLAETGASAAARALHDSESGRLIGPGLGLPEADARSRLRRYTLNH